MNRDGKRGLSPNDDDATSAGSNYETIASVIAKTETVGMYLFGALGFCWFLLPFMSKSWRSLLQENPTLYVVFDQVTRLSFPVVVFVLLFVLLAALLQSLTARHGFPGGWSLQKEGGLPTGKQVVARALYPVTVREQFVFCIWIAVKGFGYFFWAVLVGCLAYFFRIGEYL